MSRQPPVSDILPSWADVLRRALTGHGPFVALGAVGLWLRVAGLGRLALAPDEAAQAWAAWTLTSATPSPGLPAATSALLFGLQHGLFVLLGAGDALARTVPALAGAASLAVPWIARDILGRPVALSLAALLAFDPLSIAYARTGTGDVLTGTALWVALAGGLAMRAGRLRTGATVLLAAAVVGLASGPLAWRALPAWVWAVHAAWTGLGSGRARTLATVVAVTVAAATTLGTQLTGPSLVVASLRDALDTGREAAGLPWAAFAVGVLRDEVAPLTLALGGLLTLGVSGTRAALAWLAWVAVLSLSPGRDGGLWLLAAPAVLLLAAQTAASIVAPPDAPGPARPAVAAAVSAVAALLLAAVHVHHGTGVRQAPLDARPVVAPVHTEASVRPLAQAVADRVRTSGGRALDVMTADGRPDPVLAWYLRDVPGVRWRTATSASPPSVSLVMRPGTGGRVTAGVFPVRHGNDGLVEAVLR
ncbi:MAG: hypothetical protein R2708_08095 [Vicinamibacterales bacterium]